MAMNEQETRYHLIDPILRANRKIDVPKPSAQIDRRALQKEKMKKFLVGLMMVVSYCGYGQDRKLDVSFSTGSYSTPYYQKAQIGLYYAADFD